MEVLGEAGGKSREVDSNLWDWHDEEGIGSGVWDESDGEVPRRMVHGSGIA